MRQRERQRVTVNASGAEEEVSSDVRYSDPLLSPNGEMCSVRAVKGIV